MPSAIRVNFVGSSASERARTERMTFSSSFSVVEGSGTEPAFSYSTPLWTSSVASPPSSRIMFGPDSPSQRRHCSVHHQYSSSVSPFQAKTGMPWGSSGVPFGPTTIAAAAWSCVEKMLQDAQRTSAPRATSVSMSTAVCTVMCSDPEIRAPASGWASPYWRRSVMSPGISCSAREISLRPNACRLRSATLKSPAVRVMSPVILRERHRALDLVECVHRPRVDALLGGELERDEVTDEDEVEELRQLAFALGPHLFDARHDLLQQRQGHVEAPR